MSRSFGLVGLPNAGKSTIFNALTLAGAKVEAYPFCTIAPHHGVAAVPDDRLDRLHALLPDKRKVPTTIEVVDIAGLVEGASQGEGLGNQFLAEIRGVEAILHVVRCFQDPDIAHPMGEIDVPRDIAVVDGELLAKDRETLERRRERSAKAARTGDKAAQEEVSFLDRLLAVLNTGEPIRTLHFSSHELPLLRELAPLTSKPVLFVANVGDEGEGVLSRALADIAQNSRAGWIAVRGKLEAELGEACPDERERQAFLREYGLAESALVRLAAEAYRLLSVITFYTVEGPEVRAWTVPAGTKAPDAGAAIHSDFRDRFVLAEVMHLPDLLSAGSERALRETGKIHRAGRDYAVQDGDVVHFIST